MGFCSNSFFSRSANERYITQFMIGRVMLDHRIRGVPNFQADVFCFSCDCTIATQDGQRCQRVDISTWVSMEIGYEAVTIWTSAEELSMPGAWVWAPNVDHRFFPRWESGSPTQMNFIRYEDGTPRKNAAHTVMKPVTGHQQLIDFLWGCPPIKPPSMMSTWQYSQGLKYGECLRFVPQFVSHSVSC